MRRVRPIARCGGAVRLIPDRVSTLLVTLMRPDLNRSGRVGNWLAVETREPRREVRDHRAKVVDLGERLVDPLRVVGATERLKVSLNLLLVRHNTPSYAYLGLAFSHTHSSPRISQLTHGAVRLHLTDEADVDGTRFGF